MKWYQIIMETYKDSGKPDRLTSIRNSQDDLNE